MNAEQQKQTLMNLAVVLDMAGQEMSEQAMKMVIDELSAFEFGAVQKALKKCARECRYRITLADIISRIDDGRPSPEKAWQEVQHLTEDDAKVLTTEQNQAFCMVSTSLIDCDTSARITAKQTFISEYKKLCEQSRDEGRPVQYFLARANRDYEGTKALAAVSLAISENRIKQADAVRLLPECKAEILQLPVYQDQEAAGMIENMARAIGGSKK